MIQCVVNKYKKSRLDHLPGGFQTLRPSSGLQLHIPVFLRAFGIFAHFMLENVGIFSDQIGQFGRFFFRDAETGSDFGHFE